MSLDPVLEMIRSPGIIARLLNWVDDRDTRAVNLQNADSGKNVELIAHCHSVAVLPLLDLDATMTPLRYPFPDIFHSPGASRLRRVVDEVLRMKLHLRPLILPCLKKPSRLASLKLVPMCFVVLFLFSLSVIAPKAADVCLNVQSQELGRPLKVV